MNLSKIVMTCLSGCIVSGLGSLRWDEARCAQASEAVADAQPPVVNQKRPWGPEQAEGPPNTMQAGDIQTAWASLTPDGQAEWITCEYENAILPKSVVIHESYNPGAVKKVSAFDGDGKEIEVWAGIDPTPVNSPKGISVIPVKANFKIRKIKIYIDSTKVAGWNEIDAVGLRDDKGETSWAKKVEASSTFATQVGNFVQRGAFEQRADFQQGANVAGNGKPNWGTEQAEGEPDTVQAGDAVTAWASVTADGQAEWLICEYAEAIQPASVVIHETFSPGAVNKVSAFDANDKEFEVWKGVDPTPRNAGKGVSVIPIKTNFKIRTIKIYLDSVNVPGWNEIDAVGLRDAAGKTHWAQHVEASSTFGQASNNVPTRAKPVDLVRLHRLDEEVKQLRKEVDRLKGLEAEVEALKAQLKERSQQ